MTAIIKERRGNFKGVTHLLLAIDALSIHKKEWTQIAWAEPTLAAFVFQRLYGPLCDRWSGLPDDSRPLTDYVEWMLLHLRMQRERVAVESVG